jgi:hypothetical protein
VARYELVLPTDDQRPSASGLAPRLASLEGLRIGLLDNRKGNANVLLERVAQKLGAQYGVEVAQREEKLIYSRPAADDQLRRLAETSRAVVTAIGD